MLHALIENQYKNTLYCIYMTYLCIICKIFDGLVSIDYMKHEEIYRSITGVFTLGIDCGVFEETS